jgi:hypothetical protein
MTRALVSDEPLSPLFFQLYGDVRKTRNKIAHLNAGNIKAESGDILLIILTAHGHPFEKACGWTSEEKIW